jgi:hypothetical protein
VYKAIPPPLKRRLYAKPPAPPIPPFNRFNPQQISSFLLPISPPKSVFLCMKFIQGTLRNAWEVFCLDAHVDAGNAALSFRFLALCRPC